jgi:putative spermidine/putrescine transport system permease protein
MALPNHTPLNYRIWHYTYLTFCGLVFFFLIAPLFVILPLSFNAEQYIHFSAKMLHLILKGFSLRWYEDMIYGTKNPWGLATKNSLIIAFFATIGSTILGTVAALGLSSRHMPYKAAFMALLISPMIVPFNYIWYSNFFLHGKSWFSCHPYRNSIVSYNFRNSICGNYSYRNIIWF